MIALSKLLPKDFKIPDNIQVNGVCIRAQDVQAGDLCLILPSYQGRDLTEFVRMAESRGARAIVIPQSSQYSSATSFILQAESPHFLVSHVASIIYPQQPKHIVAVTGTNGKSSTVNFVNQIWAHQNLLGASLGTLGLHINSSEDFLNPNLTTPHALEVHRILNELASQKIDYLAMEASSHGLDQHRIDHVKIEAAAFTNLTQDHLDYHKTFHAYFESKCVLFNRILPQSGTAVLNADIEQFAHLEEICRERNIEHIWDFGRQAKAIQILNIEASEAHQECLLRVFDKTYTVKIPLVGEFQVYNALAAMGLVIGAGLDHEKALSSLEYLQPIPGRLEYCGLTHAGARVYVDYAHTPDALMIVLNMLRAHCRKKLHVVFGCGGNRDKSKRALMGRIASKGADVVYITDDNPRDESPAEIRQQIMSGCPSASEIGDRYEAIETAIKKASEEDIIIIAGKGHENYQIYGDLRYDFDDRLVVKEIIEKGY